ncbi:MAG: type I-E CRISPR-associated protein Cas6/Cse3/CasE [Thermodesulfobacteriota bacterium]
MYLSKVLMKGPAFCNPYEVHRTLWRLFPANAEARRDFLFRIEHSDYSCAEILMQSNGQPENSIDAARILACKAYRPILTAGHRLRFFMVANPIKTINDESRRKNARGEVKKCRVPLLHEGEQRAWIERKLGNAALIETLTIDPGSPIRFRKSKEDRVGRIQPVLFKGTLKVQIPEAMTALVKAGIGPAKAFGCGLISLARI